MGIYKKNKKIWLSHTSNAKLKSNAEEKLK